jgi:hypothetical protein
MLYRTTFKGIPPQTKLIVVAYLILLASTLVPFEVIERPMDGVSKNAATNAATNKNVAYGLRRRLWIMLMMVLPIIVSVYTIHCLVVGKCEMWAWYNSIVVFVWCCGVFVAALINIRH